MFIILLIGLIYFFSLDIGITPCSYYGDDSFPILIYRKSLAYKYIFALKLQCFKSLCLKFYIHQLYSIPTDAHHYESFWWRLLLQFSLLFLCLQIFIKTNVHFLSLSATSQRFSYVHKFLWNNSRRFSSFYLKIRNFVLFSNYHFLLYPKSHFSHFHTLDSQMDEHTDWFNKSIKDLDIFLFVIIV